MALTNYGPDGTHLVINGIPIDEFGDTNPPITVSDVENPTELKMGLGGTNVRLDRVTNPKRLVVNIMPGSAQAKQLEALKKSGADLWFKLSIDGAGEVEGGFDGVFQQRGERGRGGTSVSDDRYEMLFADGDRF